MKRSRVVSLLATACLAATLTACGGDDGQQQVAEPARPVDNDCSGGYVAFTFDDGPGPGTPAVVGELERLNLEATFFVLGEKVATRSGAEAVQEMAAKGFSIQNHGYDHASWTGETTGSAPLSQEEVAEQLNETTAAIVAAGLPEPTLYRPPYGDISSTSDLTAQRLGYRLVMPWGSSPAENILDSDDWSGLSATQIAERMIDGYTHDDGTRYRGLRAGTILAMHDSEEVGGGNAAGSLQQIVDHMNDRKLCSTTTIRKDATGGRVPLPAPAAPATGNLVRNGDLEQSAGVAPACFQAGGPQEGATWGPAGKARSGSMAQSLRTTGSAEHGHGLVLTQRGSESGCLAEVSPGNRYRMWVAYHGTWAESGDAETAVSLVTYYRDRAGAWVYWQSGPTLPATSTWNQAYLESEPLPAAATAVSFGLSMRGQGHLVTDDYVMIPTG